MWSPYPLNQDDFLGDHPTEMHDKYQTYKQLIYVGSNELLGRDLTQPEIFSHSDYRHSSWTQATVFSGSTVHPNDTFASSFIETESTERKFGKSLANWLTADRVFLPDSICHQNSSREADSCDNRFQKSHEYGGTRSLPVDTISNILAEIAKSKVAIKNCSASFTTGFHRSESSFNNVMMEFHKLEDTLASSMTVETKDENEYGLVSASGLMDIKSETVKKQKDTAMFKAHDFPRNLNLAAPQPIIEDLIAKVISLLNRRNSEQLYVPSEQTLIPSIRQCHVLFYMLQKSAQLSNVGSHMEKALVEQEQDNITWVYDPGGDSRPLKTPHNGLMGSFSLGNSIIVCGTICALMLHFLLSVFIGQHEQASNAPNDAFIILVFDPGGIDTRSKQNNLNLEDKVDLKRGVIDSILWNKEGRAGHAGRVGRLWLVGLYKIILRGLDRQAMN